MVEDPKHPAELFVPADADDQSAPVGIPRPRYFPPPTATTYDGLLCVGGELSPEWLLDAYRHGIFPWPVWDDEPMAWWCPNPRAILPLEALHVSRRLRRTVRSNAFRATCDTDFSGVIEACGTASGRVGKTWLTPPMIEAYEGMHDLGHAHSVEVWQGDALVGGVYGVAIGGLFAAESMFHRVRDASKVALVHLVAHLRAQRYELLDIQQWTAHAGRLGAIEIPRIEYLRRLGDVVGLPVVFGDALAGDPTGL